MSESNEKSIQGSLVKPAALDKKVPKKESEPVDIPAKDPTANVDIATPVDKVVSLDEEGYILFFEDDPDKFLDLPLKVVEDLSPRNKAAYAVSYTLYRKRVEESLNPPSGVTVIPAYASARQKLKFEGGRAGMHRAWLRPDQHAWAIQSGYKVANDPTLRTFCSSPSEVHTVAANGGTELVAYEIPETAYRQRLEEIGHKSAKRGELAEAQTKGELERQGGKLPDRFGAGTPARTGPKEHIRKKVR